MKASETVAAFDGEPIIPASKAILECMGYAVGNAAYPMKQYTAKKNKKYMLPVKPYLPEA